MPPPAPDPTSPAGLAVRVPGSTSNLGPGFDTLGLALSLFLDVRVTGATDDGADVVEAGGAPDGAGSTWPGAGDDLLVRALAVARRELAPGAPGLRLRVASEVPIARGLGSSAAAVAAGLLLGAALAAEPVDPRRLLQLGVALEGHPDNVVPALCGGLCAAVPLAGRAPAVVRLPLAEELGWAVAWPPVPVATRRAREVLPAQVPFADAVENPRRLALLLEGLRTADPELLALGGEDRLHVRHRLPLVPGGERALRAARDAGAWLATVSGSGSALVAVGPRGRDEELAAALARELEGGVGRAVRPVLEPARARRDAG